MTLKLKMIKFFVVIVSVIIMFMGCSNNSLEQDEKIDYQLNLTKESQINMDFSEPETDNTSGECTFSKYDMINKDFLCTKNDKVIKNDLMYDNYDFYKSKTLPKSVNKDDFIYFSNDCEVDKDGNINGDSSYLFISMNVTNKSNVSKTLCWYLKVFVIDEYEDFYYPRKLDESIPSTEVRYRSGKNGYEIKKDHFIQEIGSHETISVTLGFLYSDKYINDEMLCFIPESCDAEDTLELNKAKLIWINR